MDILKRGNESDKFTKIETESTTIPNDSDRSGSLIRRMKDSFKQSNLHVIPEDLENSEQTEQEKNPMETSFSALSKSLEPKALDHDCHRWYFGDVTVHWFRLFFGIWASRFANRFFVSWYFNVLCRSECRRAFLPIPGFWLICHTCQ